SLRLANSAPPPLPSPEGGGGTSQGLADASPWGRLGGGTNSAQAMKALSDALPASPVRRALLRRLALSKGAGEAQRSVLVEAAEQGDALALSDLAAAKERAGEFAG